MFFELERMQHEFPFLESLAGETFQAGQCRVASGVGVVEQQHQLGRQGTHPLVQDEGIVVVERLVVIDVIQHLVIENRRLRRHECRPPDFIRVFGRSRLREVYRQIGQRLERVEIGLGIAIGLFEIAGPFRPSKIEAILAVEQHALPMGVVEKWGVMRLDVVPRADIQIGIGDLSPLERQLVTQIAFCLQPVIVRLIPHDKKQVVTFRLAVHRASGQRSEQQDVFGIE